MSKPFIDLTGRRVGRLRVVRRHGTNAHGQALWWCECACGRAGPKAGHNLRTGRTRSCGAAGCRAAASRGDNGPE